MYVCMCVYDSHTDCQWTEQTLEMREKKEEWKRGGDERGGSSLLSLSSSSILSSPLHFHLSFILYLQCPLSIKTRTLPPDIRHGRPLG